VRSRPTLSDVAKLCGVTPATVRRVLNNKKAFSTSPAVRQRTLDAARPLGYVPDLAARSLSRQTTRIIGMFASPATHSAEGISEPLIEGIMEVWHASNYGAEDRRVVRPAAGGFTGVWIAVHARSMPDGR
jgi:DNA-binding LacI/PurR family transcriptional regulator